MKPLKPENEAIVAEILSELDFGIDRAECMATVGGKWQLSQRTFDRLWAEAKSRYQTALVSEQKAKDEVRVQMAIESLSKAILTKHERMEILTQIAKGELTYEKEVPSKFGPQTITARPDFSDRKAAVAELNKMDGEYAPVKKDITSGGEPLKQITGIIVE